jgi:hypothetical protein
MSGARVGERRDLFEGRANGSDVAILFREAIERFGFSRPVREKENR